MKLHLGFDPGGAGAFGWCVLADAMNPPLVICGSGVADHAGGAVTAALGCVGRDGEVLAAGIDSPLFWRTDGDRVVDASVRSAIVRLGSSSGTVNHVNSLRGACLIQGMAAAMLLRQKYPTLRLTEAHPKAALWLMKIANCSGRPSTVPLSALVSYFSSTQTNAASDHERDAALAGLAAWAMIHQTRTWRNLFLSEPKPITPLSPAPGYWVPM
jgi:hypothetical protein